MSSKSVDWRACPCGVKRGFTTRSDAEKAMGRAQAKRTRRADVVGTRRGLKVEHRAYECSEGAFHLTSENRRSFEERQPAHLHLVQR